MPGRPSNEGLLECLVLEVLFEPGPKFFFVPVPVDGDWVEVAAGMTSSPFPRHSVCTPSRWEASTISELSADGSAPSLSSGALSLDVRELLGDPFLNDLEEIDAPHVAPIPAVAPALDHPVT
jgi:hypothetical protein